MDAHMHYYGALFLTSAESIFLFKVMVIAVEMPITAPPAQIPAGAIHAHGLPPWVWQQTDRLAKGEGLGVTGLVYIRFVGWTNLPCSRGSVDI
ncbi:hypothetical protein Acife_0497 [Acidithiobacillus ferrivorans SS3]|uniref:Uncharacterized protein n=1 Tax=Acidithiobacillus ferrivorans SS3 TaxID=743299 RepID=G0JTF1_9PROT|nr:hypothetical protein Acife_0497 [Acidithiobacillus ferrivorans SS3]OFA17041.1 hypothetical protein A4U49_04250 [Acidithiobacillus ferrivorans]